jgi:hypothetical protein
MSTIKEGKIRENPEKERIGIEKKMIMTSQFSCLFPLAFSYFIRVHIYISYNTHFNSDSLELSV